MPKTVDEIRLRALQVLGVTRGGQPANNEDAAAIDVAAVAERLAAERIVDIRAYVQGDQIPEEIFIPLSEVVAADHAPLYGMGAADVAGLQAKGEATLLNIVRKTRPPVQAQIEKIVGW